MLDNPHAGVDRAVHGPVVIGVGQDVSSIIRRNVNGGFHFLEGELGHVQRIELAGNTTACHDLQKICTVTQIPARRLQPFGAAVRLPCRQRFRAQAEPERSERQ